MEVVSAKAWGRAGQLGGGEMTGLRVGVCPVSWRMRVHHVLGCGLERWWP